MNKRGIALWGTLIVACVAVWSYYLGSMTPVAVASPLMGYEEVMCDDIVRSHDGLLHCEVFLQEEDDDIRIFRSNER